MGKGTSNDFSTELTQNTNILVTPGEGGCSWEFLVGVCMYVSKSRHYFRPKYACYHRHPFSDLASKIHTRFQTLLVTNYAIIT